jgi:hypothetical protein
MFPIGEGRKESQLRPVSSSNSECGSMVFKQPLHHDCVFLTEKATLFDPK